MSLSTNLDIRSYAAVHNVRLYEIAEKMKMSPAQFSMCYMHTEMTRTTKESIKRVIREIEAEKRGTNENAQD